MSFTALKNFFNVGPNPAEKQWLEESERRYRNASKRAEEHRRAVRETQGQIVSTIRRMRDRETNSVAFVAKAEALKAAPKL